MSSSTSGISTGGITVDTFSGSSTYAASFQQVLTRAVAIASLPIQQMEVDVSNMTGEQSALSSLASTFGQLQDSLQNIDSSQVSTSATVSNTSVLNASASSSAMNGVYTVEVTNIGSQSTGMSIAGTTPVTDPTQQNISSSSSFTLTVNNVSTTITPTGTSLDDLADAINNANAGVEATVVNVGGGSGADYRLALTSTGYGQIPIQLTDSSKNSLMGPVTQGAAVQYSVNGSDPITTNTRQVTLATGLTATLLSQDPGSAVTITVGQSDTGLLNALNNFVSAYNGAATAVSQETGQNAGPLEGQSIVFLMENILSNLSQYSGGSGNITSLAQLGLQVDKTGQMSFNQDTFGALNLSDVQSFLGGLTSGGFLQAASNSLDSLTDQQSGAFQTGINNLQTQITNENSEITDKTNTVNEMQQSLMDQLSQADAAIATLQSQVSFFQQLFQTENASAFGQQ